MYRLKSLKYLVTTALITALLVTVAYVSQFIRIGNGKGILQLADGLFLALITLIKGPMLLISGVLYVTIVDVITGGFIFIPVSIVIRILMFVITYFLSRILTRYGAIFCSSLMLLWYVLYSYLLFGSAVAIVELINDAIQIAVSTILGITLAVVFRRVNHHSTNKIWDDEQFWHYKKSNQ
ncbi:hypothetical protein [Spiroplasma sp. SV19]|uniref:hypothetical protein n=1 Tax=Spiroplasma sp. SV19 TaxID=2570468 RepID=UPI0024B6AF66|nr:hypothetical protein [Spiroplasma sp. SV19]WHQ37546.1 hypothetical protein E7Y35_06865 [Spiroplasma sp. SV19]